MYPRIVFSTNSTSFIKGYYNHVRKKEKVKLFIILFTICLTGCTFSRTFNVTVDGAKAKKYGAIEEARLKSEIEIGLFKYCNKPSEH